MFMIDELNNKKVGQIAKNDFIKLIISKDFGMENLKLLTSARYSKTVFDVNYPILIEIDNINDTKKGVDSYGVNRYYKDPIKVHDHYYLITSQWYDKSKTKLINWIVEKNNNKISNIDYSDNEYTDKLFDFLKDLDYSLYIRMSDVINIVKSCSLSSYSSLQAYCEALCKFINGKEKFLKKDRIALGNFSEDNRFLAFLDNKLKLKNIYLISEINRSGNHFKHEYILKIDTSLLKKYFSFLYDFSLKCFNYYCKSNLSLDNDIENIVEKEKVIEINTSDKEYKKAIDNFEKRKVFYSKEEKLVRNLNHIGKRWFISNIELIYYWNDSRELLIEKLANSSGSNANGVRIRLSNIKWILEENLLKDAFMICKSSKNLTSKNINIEEKIDYLINKLCY